MTKYKVNTCDAEYKKDPKIKKEDILILMDWREKQIHLPEISEYMLQQFYRVCEYSLQKTKELVEFHYSYKNEAADIFEGRDFEPPRYNYRYFDVCYFFDIGVVQPNGCRLIYTALKDYNPSKYDFMIAVNMIIKIMTTITLEKGTCPGYEFIWNMEGTKAGHLTTASISGVKNLVIYFQDALPIRVIKVHVVNVASIWNKLMMLAKPFMKKELYELIKIHPNLNSFYADVSKELIPKDIGGTLSHTTDELNEIMRAKVQELHEPVQAELKLRTDETKRVGGTAAGVVSMNGSFRKLIID